MDELWEMKLCFFLGAISGWGTFLLGIMLWVQEMFETLGNTLEGGKKGEMDHLIK